MKPCAISGCPKPAKNRGWCGMHYMRWYKHGDTSSTQSPQRQMTLEDHFSLFVDKSVGIDECWPWKGLRVGKGYGQVQHGNIVYAAHRLAYDLAHPDNPLGELIARHTCDNPPCCNPHHILSGTYADNNADTRQRGRNIRGDAHWHAILREHQIPTIRALAANGTPVKAIAASFHVSKDTIYLILRGKIWAHVP